MAHNFYSRGPEGLEVANRRALGSDDNAVAQGFTHFAPTRSGPWKPLGVQGPGAPPGNQNARRKPELEVLAEQFVAKVVSTGGTVQVQIPDGVEVHFDSDLGILTLRGAKPASVLAALPAPDRSMCVATQKALDIVHDEVQDSRVSFDVERVASFASFQAEVLLRSSPLNGTFLLTVDPVIRQRAAELGCALMLVLKQNHATTCKTSGAAVRRHFIAEAG